MAELEALDFSSEVEVSSEATRKAKRPRKKKKTEDLSGSVSAHGNAGTSKAAQAQGLQKSQGHARKRKALVKSEKTRIVLSLRDLSVDDILSHVVSEVSSLCHIKSNPDKAKFWDQFKASGELVVHAFAHHLRDTFAKLYETCGTGKDKFLQFQLQWHHECSVFLLADANLAEIGFDPSVNIETAKLHDRWLGYCHGTSVATEIRNDVMISFCAEVYKYLLHHCTSVQEAISTEVSQANANSDGQSSTATMITDSDSVYYRFCGGALASMLHARYKKRDTCKPELKESVKREIKILQCIKCSDKSHIPYELQYRF